MTTSTRTTSPAAPSAHKSRRRRRHSTPRPDINPSATRASGTQTERVDAPRAVAGFAELGLPQLLVHALRTAGIEHPTPIQAATIPDALAGRDVLGRARTGSGKTLAFGAPLLARLAGDARSTHPRAVVLLPTRELAQQVEAALRPLANALHLRLRVVVGGLPINRDIAALRSGVDVVIATPGRLDDLLGRKAVSLRHVRVAVLDEADHMADLGFLPTVTRIMDAMPEDRQCLLFSATLDRDVDRLVARYLARPAIHRVDEPERSDSAMQHRVFRLSPADKVQVATEIATRPQRTLFFVRTKHRADRLARQMRNCGVGVAALHGNLNQNQRRRALDGFASGSSPVLVATDIAARGIHVDDLDLVVHFDPPTDPKVYAHRSGRTARAGATGTVLTFVEPQQQQDMARLHAALDVDAQSASVRPGHPAIGDLGGRAVEWGVTPSSGRKQPPTHARNRPLKARGARSGRR